MGQGYFVLLRKAVHFLEVTKAIKHLGPQCPLDEGEFLFGVSFIRGSTLVLKFFKDQCIYRIAGNLVSIIFGESVKKTIWRVYILPI